MFIIIISIAAIMSSSFTSGNLLGDISAFGTSFFMAISFTLTRRFKEINMVPAMAISGVISALIAVPLITFIGGTFILMTSSIPYLLVGAIFVSIAFALITLGPRYMPAPEVGLIMPLETVLGSYLGWIFLSEEPNKMTLYGGIVVIVTLFLHAYLSLKDNRD